MKAKLIFDLDDFDDSRAHLRAVKSLDLCLLLFDFFSEKRCHLDSENSEDFNAGIELVYDRMYDLMDKHRINLEELIE